MLILGSCSPRRKEILGYFKIPFEQASPSFDERSELFTGDPVAYASKLAIGKAKSLLKQYPNRLLLTADTIVFQQGKLFCKPDSRSQGLEMLRQFNGKWHSIFTAVAVAKSDQLFVDYEETEVLFHEISEEDLQLYHKAFSSEDYAGGYGIQLGGSIIIKRIEGCFYNVMGLPISTVSSLLKKVGVDLWHYL